MLERDQWAEGDAYEPYVGRWSRLVANRFINWLEPAPDARWLDVGCGTGALTETILAEAQPSSVWGVDPSTGFLEFARSRLDDDRARFAVGDAEHLPSDVEGLHYAVSGLVLNFLPDPEGALDGLMARTRPGGCVAAYVWDYADGMEMMRYFWDAATELDPHAASLDEGRRFPICSPDPLRSLWEGVGLEDVAVVPLEIDTVFGGFDDYWSPFLGGQGPAPAYNMSLSGSERDELRSLLDHRLPKEADGSIRLRARAWAVRGTLIP
jgi:trans-aconitate methyltransferase